MAWLKDPAQISSSPSTSLAWANANFDIFANAAGIETGPPPQFRFTVSDESNKLDCKSETPTLKSHHLSQFDSNKDYYSILGASEDASPREVESLFRRLARERHPDHGGTEEEMKALNEAYRVLRDETARSEYDSHRRKPAAEPATINVNAPAREVGVHGQALSALLCVLLGLVLLGLVRFNGLWFLWPMAILALGVMFFGVLIAHSAMTNARASLRSSHPARRFRAVQEAIFWAVVCGAGYGLYLVLTAI